MGRNGHGLRGVEAALHRQRAGVSAVLPRSFVSLQDSSTSGVFRHGITKECFWQNSQARITRAILGRPATRGWLSSGYETVAFPHLGSRPAVFLQPVKLSRPRSAET